MFQIKSFLISLTCILFSFSATSDGQLWSGVLSPARATDWSQAGVIGGIPSDSWSQCGPAIAAYSGSAATINNAIAFCGSNHYVLLGPGTFSLSTGIDFAHKSNVVLRGSGANSTLVVFGSSASINCGGYAGLICISSSDYTYFQPSTIYNWTAGYTQGTNQVTLSKTAGITPNSTVLVLNQLDDASDSGNYFNCGAAYTGSSGCSFNGPDSGNGTTGRFQTEMTLVTAVNSATGVVTLAAPLKHPNWRSGQSPQAWFFQPIANSGVENFSIDASATGTISAVQFFNAANVWVKGLRVLNVNVVPVWAVDTIHAQFEQNYFYQARNADPFGFRFTVACDALVQNNIIQQIRVPILDEGPDCGTVVAYNFTIEDYFNSDAMFQSARPHANGDDYELYEGNVSANYYGEDYHGTHLMQTGFRNFYTGWESYNPPKDYQTQAFMLDSYNRYTNAIGNVLGTAGYHSVYQSTATPADNHAIYAIGTGNNAVSPAVPGDSVVAKTFFRWGNYDTVTSAVRFCGNSSNTGWSNVCGGNSEVPSGISVYPNSVPTVGDTGSGQAPLPASFYLSFKPKWWGNHAWPPIGPDVSDGNVGICSGGTYNMVAASSSSQCAGGSLVTGLAGHVNLTPAMDCYLNTMGGAPSGSGKALTFNADACYSNSSGPAPAAPTGLGATVQ